MFIDLDEALESCRSANSSSYLFDLIKRCPHSCFDDNEKQQLQAVEDDFWAANLINMDWLLGSSKFRQVVVCINGAMAEMITVDPRAFVLSKLYMVQSSVCCGE